MRILFISYYFEPDLSAGSFRNSSLFKVLLSKIEKDDFIHVITTQPNRYCSYKENPENNSLIEGDNFKIDRITIPPHKNGMLDQAKSYIAFYREARQLTRNYEYDLVYSSSSRLFSAFLGRNISVYKRIPLYLDIRDIFADTIKDVLNKSKLISIPVFLFAKTIEKLTFSKATHINLVSEGFRKYFSIYPQANYSFFTNGIDDIFTDIENSPIPEGKIIITYAGNIGSGQGLEKVIPQAAAELGTDYLFRIIGDGGTKKLLLDKVAELKINNVEVIPPVNRQKLINYYHESTYLFFHLNDLNAFKKVLPSKVFEYGAFNKPIIAGVSGYAAEFVKTHVSNHILFEPTDVASFVSQLKAFKPVFEKRTEFIEKFSRKNIMNKMAESILNYVRIEKRTVKCF